MTLGVRSRATAGARRLGRSAPTPPKHHVYTANLGTARSPVWLVGALANTGLFVVPWVSRAA